jgi:Transposase DDE domain
MEPNPNRKPPKVISLSDPASAWTAKANKRVQFGYGLNYMIDVENAVIVDVEATPARTYDEVKCTEAMIARTERTFGLKPDRLMADTAYGTGKFLRFVVDAGIAPYIPVWDKTARNDGTFSRADFAFDKEKNIYTCPAGKTLTTTGHVSSDHAYRYLASIRDCKALRRCSQKWGQDPSNAPTWSYADPIGGFFNSIGSPPDIRATCPRSKSALTPTAACSRSPRPR